MSASGIQTRNPNKRATADLRFRRRDHCVGRYMAF